MRFLNLPLRGLATLLASAIFAGIPAGAATVPAPIVEPNYPVAPTARDGIHDFDFEFGTWRTHYRLLKDRLAGSHVWYDCYGTSLVRPFWDGGGNLEDGDLKCPNKYIGGMTVRTYDLRTHQWTIWWGTRKLAIAPPAQVGHYDAEGTGDFYAYDKWKGTPVIIRFQWTHPDGKPRFEQAFSADNGKTWETNWTTDYERVSANSKGVWNAHGAGDDQSRGFDSLFGTWRTHYMRMRYPLSADHSWYACDGMSTVVPFWGGSANTEDGDLHCPSQYVRGVTVRLYVAGEWLLYWGTQAKGLAPGLPQAGRFAADGTGDFLAPDTYDGKPILVRYRWRLRVGNPRFEEAFSPDNGKTWETVWTTDYTR